MTDLYPAFDLIFRFRTQTRFLALVIDGMNQNDFIRSFKLNSSLNLPTPIIGGVD
jgi:hypothetical protein